MEWFRAARAESVHANYCVDLLILRVGFKVTTVSYSLCAGMGAFLVAAGSLGP